MTNPRQTVQVGVRCVSAALAVGSSALLLWPVIEHVLRFDYASYTLPWTAFWSVVWWASLRELLTGPLTLMLTAIALWLLQRPLSRLLVPWEGLRCPACGYSLHNLKGTRCPECGAETSGVRNES